MGHGTGRTWTALALAGALLATTDGLAAQDREQRDCRCLDRDGNETERCVCFFTPEPGGFAMGERRPMLGVSIRQDQPSADDARGARLFGVQQGGPAEQAGLRDDDVVTRVGGRSVLEPLADARAEDRLSENRSLPVQRLLALLAEHEAGDRVEIEYLRDGQTGTATVELEEPRAMVGFAPGARSFGAFTPGMPGMHMDPGVPMAAPQAFAFGDPGAAFVVGFGQGECPDDGAETDARTLRVFEFGRSCVAGVELLELSEGLASHFGARAGQVLVADARADNPLGLAAGDVLVSVDGRDVQGLERALRVLRSYEESEEIDLQVLRHEQTTEVRGKLR